MVVQNKIEVNSFFDFVGNVESVNFRNNHRLFSELYKKKNFTSVKISIILSTFTGSPLNVSHDIG